MYSFLSATQKINMKFTYQGLMAPVFTPFSENMVINLDVIGDYARFLNNSGIKGVLVNGTSGEGPSLSTSERKNIAEKWKVAVTNTKQHLMLQIGGAPLPDVLELAKHAEKIGVDSILCLPELYFKPSTTLELIDYLKVVGAAAPNTPLLYYHIPSFSNVNIKMGKLMNEIVNKVPTFCGIKFTSTALDEGLQAVQANEGKYTVFLGADNILAGALSTGFNSAIETTLNILPQLSIDILNSVNNCDLKKAREAQTALNIAIEHITANGTWVSTMKHAMNLLTPIKVGKVRYPLKNLSEEQVKEMRLQLESLGYRINE